jgi:16S rRNA G1207 methylase RsmC
VLEPSAGEGAIAKVLRDEGANVDCVEIDPVRFEKLDAAGFNVTKADFLKFSPDREYDFIVMNPPFAKYQDIDHVMHAIQFLKPGGRLVSVMSLGWTFHSTKKAQLFRDLEEEFAFRDYEELPAGTFKSSGTNVSSTLVFLEGH